jgi:hypothetical protein
MMSVIEHRAHHPRGGGLRLPGAVSRSSGANPSTVAPGGSPSPEAHDYPAGVVDLMPAGFSDEARTSDWPILESDLRRALVAAGHPAGVIDRMISDLCPVVLAVERCRKTIDAQIVWALLGVCADRARRRAPHSRTTQSSGHRFERNNFGWHL